MLADVCSGPFAAHVAITETGRSLEAQDPWPSPLLLALWVTSVNSGACGERQLTPQQLPVEP